MSPSETPSENPSETPPGAAPTIGFQPAQPQRWSLFHGFAQAVDSHTAHHELRAWGLLAMVSLGVAGIFA